MTLAEPVKWSITGLFSVYFRSFKKLKLLSFAGFELGLSEEGKHTHTLEGPINKVVSQFLRLR